MSEKVAFRLRQNNLQAKQFFFKLKSRNTPIAGCSRVALATNDGLEIYLLCRTIFLKNWHGQGFYQVNITALELEIT